MMTEHLEPKWITKRFQARTNGLYGVSNEDHPFLWVHRILRRKTDREGGCACP